MTPAHLAAIREKVKDVQELAEKATRGPWWVRLAAQGPQVCSGAGHVCYTKTKSNITRPEADAAFIAASRNWPSVMAELLAELEEARKDAERYQWMKNCTAPEMGFAQLCCAAPEHWDGDIDAAIAKEKTK